jgi:hypothetical protein
MEEATDQKLTMPSLFLSHHIDPGVGRGLPDDAHLPPLRCVLKLATIDRLGGPRANRESAPLLLLLLQLLP